MTHDFLVDFFLKWSEKVEFSLSVIAVGLAPTALTLCKLKVLAYLYVHTLSKIVVQTNLPSIGKTYIFRTGMMSTFTWTMPYKSIPVLIIT